MTIGKGMRRPALAGPDTVFIEYLNNNKTCYLPSDHDVVRPPHSRIPIPISLMHIQP